MKIGRATIFLATTFLAGCAGNTGVIPAGKDTYMIANKSQTAFATGAEMLAILYQQANDFCKKKGMYFQPIREKSSDGAPYVKAKGELRFRCLSKHDHDYRRPNMEKEPDIKIETQ